MRENLEEVKIFLTNDILYVTFMKTKKYFSFFHCRVEDDSGREAAPFPASLEAIIW